MMKRLIYTMLFLLAGLAGMAQTNEPLPGDAEPLTNQLYLSPSDSTVWAADPFSGLAIKVGTWFKVDSLFKEGYTKVQVDSAITVNISFHNVKSFGAVGDGVTDDTEAIRDAMDYLKTSGDGRLFFPEGVYMISGTIYVPSDVEIFGDGKEKSVIKNMTDADLDLVVPFGVLGNTAPENRGKFLPMWATETSAEGSADSVRNIVIHNLGFDYNGANVGGYSATCLLMGRAVNCHIRDVYFYPTLPLDLGASQNRGSNMLFAFAEDCSVRNSVFTAADYESLSIRYISKNIRVTNNVFDIDKPTGLHVQDHAMQIAPPPPSVALNTQMLDSFGTLISGPAYVENNTFLLKSNVSCAATAHRTKGFYATNNFIETFPGHSELTSAIKPFDGTSEVIVSGNYIDLRNTDSERISAIQTNGPNGAGEDVYLDCSDYIITGNIVKVPSRPADADLIRPTVGNIMGRVNNMVISSNVIEIIGYGNRRTAAIGVNGSRVNVHDNTIVYSDNAEPIDTGGPAAIYVASNINSAVSYNTVVGSQIGYGVFFNQDSTTTNIRLLNNTITNGDEVNVPPPFSETNIATYRAGGHTALTPSTTGSPAQIGGTIRFSGNANGSFIDIRRLDNTGNSLAIRGYATNGVQADFYDGAVRATGFRLSALNTPPASATATGTAGEIRFGTDGRIYICTATNTWIRSEPLTTWP